MEYEKKEDEAMKFVTFYSFYRYTRSVKSHYLTIINLNTDNVNRLKYICFLLYKFPFTTA